MYDEKQKFTKNGRNIDVGNNRAPRGFGIFMGFGSAIGSGWDGIMGYQSEIYGWVNFV